MIYVVRSASASSPAIQFGVPDIKIINLRPDADDFGAVTRFLNRYDGPVYSATEQERLAQASAGAMQAARAGDAGRARSLLDSVTGFRGTEEFQLAEVYVLRAEDRRDAAIGAALALLERGPTLPVAADTAETLWMMYANLEALPTFAEIAESPSLWRFRAHYMMADVFRRNQQPYAAINHFTWCLNAAGTDLLDSTMLGEPHEAARENIRGRLAMLWFFVGDDAEYRTYFESVPDLLPEPLTDDLGLTLEALAIQNDPDQQADTSTRCHLCRAIIFREGYVCTLCGAHFRDIPRAPTGLRTADCPMCHNKRTVTSAVKVPFCITCRKLPGEYVNNRPVSTHLLPRGPRGQFSILPHLGPKNAYLIPSEGVGGEHDLDLASLRPAGPINPSDTTKKRT